MCPPIQLATATPPMIKYIHLVLNFSKFDTQVLVFGENNSINVGDYVFPTGNKLQVYVGLNNLGSVLNGIGKCITNSIHPL